MAATFLPFPLEKNIFYFTFLNL